MKKLKPIWIYLKPYKSKAILNVVFNLLSTLFSALSVGAVIPFLKVLFNPEERSNHVIPFEISNITEWGSSLIKAAISSWSENYGTANTLLMLSVGVMVMGFFRNLFRYLALHVMVPIRNGILRDLRNKLYNKINDLHLAFFSESKKGDVIAKMTGDVQEIEWSIMSSLEMIFRDPIAIIVQLTILIVMSPQLTLFIFILLPISALLMGRIGKNLKKVSFRGQKKMGGLLSIIEETLGGTRIIKAFNAEDFVKERSLSMVALEFA